MRPLILSLALLAGCASSSNVGSASDAQCLHPVTVDPNLVPSSPTGCPSEIPVEGASCAPSGLVCHGYGAFSLPTTATCSNTCTWVLTTPKTPCCSPPDAAAEAD